MPELRIPVNILYNRDLNSMASEFRDSLRRELKETVRKQSWSLLRHMKSKYFSGEPYLKHRSGNLKKSIVKTMEKIEYYLGYLAITGGATIEPMTPYAGVHVRESRADSAPFTIYAKNRNWLTVPVYGGPADRKIRKRADQFNELFPVYPKNKTAFLALERRSGKIEPVFWLKKKVNVPPTVFVEDIIDDFGPSFTDSINKVVNDFLKRNRQRKVFR